MATVASDLVGPTKYGGKYTVTLIPGKPSLCLIYVRGTLLRIVFR